MPSISHSQLELIKHLYENQGKSMNQIAQHLNVSIDAVFYFMRKNRIARRTPSQANELVFAAKPKSYTYKKANSLKLSKLEIAGTMLYWAEGYKGKKGHHIVDFTNSDPKMISMFMRFLREIFSIDESRLRVALYCYDDQDISSLQEYWSKLTRISTQQFTKPYVQQGAKTSGRKLEYGVLHIRYNDKKLLYEIKNLIESYCLEYA